MWCFTPVCQSPTVFQCHVKNTCHPLHCSSIWSSPYGIYTTPPLWLLFEFLVYECAYQVILFLYTLNTSNDNITVIPPLIYGFRPHFQSVNSSEIILFVLRLEKIDHNEILLPVCWTDCYSINFPFSASFGSVTD